jgi:hypothetical protein
VVTVGAGLWTDVCQRAFSHPVQDVRPTMHDVDYIAMLDESLAFLQNVADSNWSG